MERYFAFSSGGARHFLGLGDWKIRADALGNFTVEHNLMGGLTNFGPFRLSPAEARSLWERIAAAELERRRGTSGRGTPDEAVLAFVLFAEEGLHSVQLWASEAFSDSSIQPLVNEIGSLIEKYTGRKPVLR
jgi:hypothetical protein